MVARVLIVIVVVAVLGFFGTRGSEKVVEEVTERQEVVDALRRDVQVLQEQVKALEAQLAQQQAQRDRLREDDARVHAALDERMLDAERKLREHDGVESAIPVIAPRGAIIRVDGVRQGDTAITGGDVLRLKRGSYTVESDLGGKTTRYQLVVGDPSAQNKIVLIGAGAGAGNVTVKRLQ